MTGVFSRALVLSAAAAALTATVSFIGPAAQASSRTGAQLTGTQLAAALLPVSYFPSGYQKGPSQNSGNRLEHGRARYSLTTMSCKELFTYPPLTGYGETAAAIDYVTGQASATTLVVPTYFQGVYQFASSAGAAAYFQADYESYLRCWSGSVTQSHTTWSWVTQSVTKGHFDGNRAFYAHLTVKFSGSPASHSDQEIVLAGPDVFTVAASGVKVPTRPEATAVMASMIARVRG
jgi:hypothetical protein